MNSLNKMEVKLVNSIVKKAKAISFLEAIDAVEEIAYMYDMCELDVLDFLEDQDLATEIKEYVWKYELLNDEEDDD